MDTPDLQPEQITPPQKPSFEFQIGIHWFSRIGIAILMIGLAMALSYSYPYLSAILTPQIKLLLAGLLGVGMFAGGTAVHKRFALLGRILQGGGLATGYLTLFGMFFIPQVQLVQDTSFAWPVLFLYVALMTGVARKFESFSVALVSLGFGYFTAFYADQLSVALIASAALGLATIVLGNNTDKPAWGWLPFVGMFGSALLQVYWFVQMSFFGQHQLVDPQMTQSVSLVTEYLMFHIASLLPRQKGAPVLATFNTMIFFAVFYMVNGDKFFGLTQSGLLAIMIAAVHAGTMLCLSAINPARSENTTPNRRLHQSMALIFTGLGTTQFFTGVQLASVLALQTVMLGVLGNRDKIWRIAAPMFQLMALFSLPFLEYGIQPDWSIFLAMATVGFSGLMLEHSVFRHSSGLLRWLLGTTSWFVLVSAVFTATAYYWTTIALVGLTMALMLCGFLMVEKKYRWAGLAVLFVALFRLMTVDLVSLETPYKIMLFLLVGGFMLAGSYWYNLLAMQHSYSQAQLQKDNPSDAA